MKIAMIGAGAWGINIARTLRELQVLTAMVEPNPQRASDLAKEFSDLPILPQLQDLATLEIDAVAIATPVPTHFSVASEALNRGWHVFVEKPMTFSVAEAKNLLELSKSKNKVLMVGHLLLYQPAIRWISHFLKEDGLGKLFSISQERLNFGRARSAEDALWSLGVHDLAVLTHLTEDFPTSFTVSAQKVLQSHIADDLRVHFEFPQGIRAHLHVSWLWPEKRRGITLLGEKGMLVFDELSGKVTLHKKTISPSLTHQDQGASVVFESQQAPLKIELQHFIDCATSGKQPLSDGNNGLQVVKLLQAISPVTNQRESDGN